MQQVSPNVYVETGLPGCNPGFVITEEGIVMIDAPQQPSDALRWRDEIEAKGEIRYLINTEHHHDHIIGNFFFPGIVVAHQKTRESFFSYSVDDLIDKVKATDPNDVSLMDGYFLKKPHITFSNNLNLYLGQHTFELIYLPGHTAGMISVYIPHERVVFTGDNVFHKVQTYLHHSYPDDWLRSLKTIENLDVDVIVPGHGKVCDKNYLKEQASFIEEWIEAVKEAIRNGLSKEEAKDKISFLDRYPMDIGITEARAREVQRMNVERLYDYYERETRFLLSPSIR